MKTVYVLSNLGTPADASDQAVAKFLKEFLYDPAVIPLPAILRYPLVHWLIAPRRGKKSGEKYRAIWRKDGSPLLVWSLAQQREVQKHLPDPVLLGMRYGEPSLPSALEKAKQLGAERIVLVPLYPQFAEATTGSTAEYFRRLAKGMNVTVFPSFPKERFYLDPLAATIRPHLRPGSHLLLTFHGLPVKAKGAPEYRAQCQATAEETAKLLGLPRERWTFSFQSRFGRAKWIGPHTEDLLTEFPRQGKTDLVVAAPSFVADCLETAEELGIQARETFLQAGGQQFMLVDCLNGNPDFARGLAEALMQSNVA